MKTVLFSKDGDTLVLKYNPTAVRRTLVLITIMFIIIIVGLYLLAIGLKAPHDSGDFIFLGLMFGLYLIAIAYYSYTVFARRQVELIKSYDGYIVRKNNKIKTGAIRLITKRRVMKQHDEGYSIIVTDIDDKRYTLFETLREQEALELTLFLSTEMNLPVESTEGSWW